MYRVNSNGGFNVPFNQNNTINIYQEKNLQAISLMLSKNKIKILNQDYLKILDKAQENDFIFCDPPYDTDTNQFTSYSKKGFGKKEQQELANKLKELDKKNVKWMLTNHDTNDIKEWYKDFNISIIRVNRSINSNGSKRKNACNEVIITNYQVGNS